MSGIAPLSRPKLFVHGNPETSAIWRPLTRELVARGCARVEHVSPPGFGAPVPDGWNATQREYRDWLVDVVESFGEPVDVVGHDWGAGHVYGMLTARPANAVTWAADCGGLVHPDYTWHDAALGWQTPEVGEAMVEGLVGLPMSDKVAAFVGLGMSADVAESVAEGVDETMGRCILALYRSAAQPAMRELGDRIAGTGDTTGGAVIIPTADPYPGTPQMARDVANRLGATVIELDGRGHWWMLEDAAGAAAALVSFWSAHAG